MAKSKFTEDEIKHIIQLYQSGISIKEISYRTHSGYTTINNLLKKSGVFQYKNRRWTNEEINFLKANYSSMSWENLLSNLSRWKKVDLIEKASTLGIKRDVYYWTDEDVAILSNNYSSQGDAKKVYELLDHKFDLRSIYEKAHKLGLATRSYWTDKEDKLLKEFYSIKSMDEICQMLPNRRRTAIISHALSLGLQSKIVWKENEIQFLKDHYLEMRDEEISQVINHPSRSVQMKRLQLGLYRQIFENCYTNISQYLRRNNSKWRADSERDCNYKCVITGDQYDDVHHLHSMNLIIAETMESLGYEHDVDPSSISYDALREILAIFIQTQSKYPLGVCLRKDIHIQFHKEYGLGNNTIDQFQQFLQKHSYSCVVV